MDSTIEGFVLGTGAVLIASVIDDGDKMIKLKYGFLLAPTAQGMGLMPFPPHCEDGVFSITANALVGRYDIDNALKNSYEDSVIKHRAAQSGIQLIGADGRDIQ